ALLRETRDRLLRHEEATQAAIYDLQDGLAGQGQQPAGGVDGARRLLLRKVRECVRTLLPRDAKILVASQGDPALVDLYARQAAHFPQDAGGRYYPNGFANAHAAIIHLEALRIRGADYLVLAGPALSLLATFPEFKSHLDARYRL